MFVNESFGQSSYPEYVRDGLELHNQYRTKHGVPSLQLNDELCSRAQEWANNCAKKGKLEMMESLEWGENSYTANRDTSITHVVTKWYEDGKVGYNYTAENPKKHCGEFTQMIWKSTTDLGLGMATSTKHKLFIVALYCPKGNIRGQFVENVLPRLQEAVTEKLSDQLRSLLTRK